MRSVTAADRVGFSLHLNEIADGDGRQLWYKNQREANLVIGGRGTVTEVAIGRERPLGYGTTYLVGPEDRHDLESIENAYVLSVFSPPFAGDEQHDADRALALSGPVPPGSVVSRCGQLHANSSDCLNLWFRDSARAVELIELCGLSVPQGGRDSSSRVTH